MCVKKTSSTGVTTVTLVRVRTTVELGIQQIRVFLGSGRQRQWTWASSRSGSSVWGLGSGRRAWAGQREWERRQEQQDQEASGGEAPHQ